MPRNPYELPRRSEEPREEFDDLSLVDRCIRGQPAAWQLLIERVGPAATEAARYTLRRVLGRAHPEDVENVVQSVFMGLCDRSFHRLRLFQGRSKLKTWITAVTTRFALNYIRTEKRKGSLKFASLSEVPVEQPQPERRLPLTPEEKETLYRGIDKLPPRERLLLKLCFFDELAYREIADVLKIPVNSVSPMLVRAKENLRKILGA
ncbi:MAG: sigma-70 family RNA polymerase sigma factor [Planctomycetes bacterium]|nr:sigma-70 family RNA polymerase sigma factor [Planctomycetota bacterium]